ncbi:MAG TPA: gephyrin-like molybdotransferase Glp, partial [Pirellulales bacterium]|nr:gephyrin-like molybdotransferase Glp [Pirellulales bacterium]
DGYAVQAADLANGVGNLQVIEEVVAGDVPKHLVRQGQVTRIMTGAPLPEGADSVVMFERTTTIAPDRIEFDDPRFEAGQNIARRASSMRAGQCVLNAGSVLRGIEIGLLAEVGRTEVRAIPRPTVAVLATGNELVDSHQRPTAGQIRNTNGPMLMACLDECGVSATDLGIARDDHEGLREAIERGLDCDVLLISGGVSAGVLDLVPGVLAELGVEQVFHKVRVKPGKPLWFGVQPHASGPRLVFGLPGNPVSGYVCFQLFVRSALVRLAGREDVGLARLSATLASEQKQRGDRATYAPARVTFCPQGAAVESVGWKGSGDLAGLSRANALVCFPAGDRIFAAGEQIDVLLLGR